MTHEIWKQFPAFISTFVGLQAEIQTGSLFSLIIFGCSIFVGPYLDPCGPR